jgi:hypothetical protein
MTRNNLFVQVNDLIDSKSKITTNPTTPTLGNNPIAISPVAPIVDQGQTQAIRKVSDDIAALRDKIDSLPNQIITGMDVYAIGDNIVGLGAGKVITKEGVGIFGTNTRLTAIPSQEINQYVTIDNARSGVVYITAIGGNDTRIETKYELLDDDLVIAKIVINQVNAPIYDDSDGSNNYIVSGKDLVLNPQFKIDDDTRAAFGTMLDQIFADNLYGQIKLSEGLTITNQQDSVRLNSTSMQIYDDTDKLAEFNRDGVYYYQSNGQILSQYTRSGATVGNIQVTPTSIQSLNYNSGNKGFQINSNGNAEFNNVKVRGNVTALSGNIGKWVIGRDRLTDSTDTTGLAPQDYPFYAGQTFNNRATAPFRVTSSGVVYALNAILSGSITATSGTIGGWSIGLTTLSSVNSKIILDSTTNSGKITVGNTGSTHIQIIGNSGGNSYIQSSNFSNSVVNPKGFRFGSDGTIEAVDGYFRGQLEGNVFTKNLVSVVAGDMIMANSTKLSTNVNSSTNTILITSGVFSTSDIIKVDNEIMYIATATGTTLICGRGYNSTADSHNEGSVIYKIGELFQSNKGYIELLGNNNRITITDVSDSFPTLTQNVVVELGLLTQGSKAGQYGLYAQVAEISGNITATTLTTQSGTIGGWTIGSSTLSGGSTILNSNGTVTCANLIANTAGSVGGWSIGSTTLTGGTVEFNNSGYIKMGPPASGFIRIDSTSEYDPYRLWVGNFYPTVSPFKITNSGTTYTNKLEIGTTIFISSVYDTGSINDAYAISEYSGVLYAAAGNKIYSYSTGSSWAEFFTSSQNNMYSSITFSGQLFFGNSNGNYIRFNGSTWSSGVISSGNAVRDFVEFSGVLYAASEDGDVYSWGGSSWSSFYSSPESGVMSLTVFSGAMFAGTLNQGKVYRYDGSWTQFYDSTAQFIYSLYSFNGDLYIGSRDKIEKYSQGVFSTIYSGAGGNIYGFVEYKGKLLATCENVILEYNLDTDEFQIMYVDSFYRGVTYSLEDALYITGEGDSDIKNGIIDSDAILHNGVLTIKETTTPTAVTDYGKIYTKSDNKLYFQDGAGTEHEIAFV